MKIFLAHNHYRQSGGEDAVVAAEASLLRELGCTVFEYRVHNRGLRGRDLLASGATALWSHASYTTVKHLLRHLRPDVMHVHNTLPRLSPAIYYAAREEGVAVVQSLHNYRMLCANGLLFRAGQPCDTCGGKRFAWPAVVHGCYHNRLASAAVAAMTGVHQLFGTWQRQVDLFIAPTRFVKNKFVAAGWPSDHIIVKRHFSTDPGPGNGGGGYALYVGRLDAAKGIPSLLEAWRRPLPVPLKIIGDGPLAPDVAAAAACNPAVQWLGWRSPSEVAAAMADALCVVAPSISYETGCRVIIEALACGTPVIAASVGAAAEMVKPGATGLCYEPGRASELADNIVHLAQRPDLQKKLRHGARAEYRRHYTLRRNQRQLIAVYHRAMALAKSTASKPRRAAC